MNDHERVRYNPFQLLLTINNMICITEEEEKPPGAGEGRVNKARTALLL